MNELLKNLIRREIESLKKEKKMVSKRTIESLINTNEHKSHS